MDGRSRFQVAGFMMKETVLYLTQMGVQQTIHLEEVCHKCFGNGINVIYDGEGIETTDSIECEECVGTGSLVTPTGRKLLDFVERNIKNETK